MTPGRYRYYIAAILLLCGCLVGILVQVEYKDMTLVDLATSWQRLTAFIKDKNDIASCQALLDGVITSRKNVFHTVCEEHNYDRRDTRECFRRAVECDGRPNHLVFLGDSRIREQFQHFIQFLGSNETSDEYVDEEYSLKVTYVPHRQPLNNDYLLKLEQILNLHLTERPRLLATSAVLDPFSKRYEITFSVPPKCCVKIEEILYKARPLFDQLSNTTDILWTIQGTGHTLQNRYHAAFCYTECVLYITGNTVTSGPSFQSYSSSLHGSSLTAAPIAEAIPDVKRNKVTIRCVELKSDCKGWHAREKWLLRSYFNRFNDAAERILTNSSVRFWAEYRLAGHRYAFDLHDGIHLTHRQGTIPKVLEDLYLRSLRRHHPPAHLTEKRLYQQLIKKSKVPPQWIKFSNAFRDRSQVLVNFYCNRHLFKSESDFCCVQPHERSKVTSTNDTVAA